MLNKIQERFDAPLNFMASRLLKAGATPTFVSVIGLLFAAISASGYYFYDHGLLMKASAAAFLMLSGLCDALDGALARLCSRATRLGGILDSTFDRLGEILIYSALTVGDVVPAYAGVAALSSSLMVSYIRSRAEAEGIMMKGRGVAERPERLIILFGATLLNQLYAGLLLIAALSSITLLQRVHWVQKSCRSLSNQSL